MDPAVLSPSAGQRVHLAPGPTAGRRHPRTTAFRFPPDDRKVYYPNTYPFNCIGRLFAWANFAPNTTPDSWGTASLVGPRHVVTAKHVCPPTTASNWSMLFIPAYWDGSSVYGMGARSFVSNIVFLSGATAAHDVAVLRLFDPLGSQLGWVDIFDLNTFHPQYNPSGGLYWKAGYPFDVAGGLRPSYEQGVTVLEAVPDGSSLELHHQADVEGGASGSPLFGYFEYPLGVIKPYVDGVNSGAFLDTTTGEKYNVDAGGWPLHSIVAFARSFWP
jgi:V8-like Glu-specific endopeptidase